MNVMKKLFAQLRRLNASKSGSFALKTALAMPVFMSAAAGSLDFIAYNQHKSIIQNAADAGALAAVKEAALKGWSTATADAVAKSVVISNIQRSEGDSTEYKVKTQIDEKERRVTVIVSQDYYPYFSASVFPTPQIQVDATASAAGNTSTCIIAQSTDANKALDMSGDAYVRANDCAAYSNSADLKGLSVKEDAKLESLLTCSSGGFHGNSQNYNPMPVTNCPPLGDPLATRAKLIDESLDGELCDYNKNFDIKLLPKILSPGVYCGEVKISHLAIVTMKPGLYIFKNANLKVEQGAKIIGKDVSIILTGDKSNLVFRNNSIISLSARETGPMAGILIYVQPSSSQKGQRLVKIESKDAKKLVGTVYLPDDKLTIGGDADGDGLCDPDILGGIIDTLVCNAAVGDHSAWTAIVANEIKVTAGVRLVINSNYDSTPVPAPDGIGPDAQVRLVD